MPVVINEMEVVPGQEPGAAAGSEKPSAGAAPPQDVERLLKRIFDRAMRLRAH